MNRLATSLFGLAIAIFAFGIGVDLFGPAGAQPTNRVGAPADAKRSHFLHGDHAASGVEITKCRTCHTIEASGKVLAPAAQGHAPCLNSGCHADKFLVISEKNSKNPAMAETYAKASAFCLACHDQVPWAWKKPTTRVLQGWQNQREHHIEMAKSQSSNMDHYQHAIGKKKDGSPVACVDCHALGPDFKLVVNAPGHAQCVQCHSPSAGVAFAMDNCGRCHKEGSRDEFLRKVLEEQGKELHEKEVPSRPGADVRACDSSGDAEYKKKNKKAPCFKHETKEHRTKEGGDVQCKQCHWIIVDKAKWGKLSFSSLADLHLNKIIGDSRKSDHSEQHKACAGCHPHTGQVKLRGGNCQYCHVERTEQEPYW